MAFSLDNAGDISQPFLTDYGWHVVKLIEKKPIPSFQDIESDLKKMIQKDSRNELSKQAFYRKLHQKYKVANRPSEYASLRKKHF